MPFVVGETVGPYRIIAQLGSGGMATVFTAYHPALDRYVALKALHPAFMEDSGFLARFQREARLVAKLEHPNIVPIYDAAEHEGRPYLVMKFIEGETLKARLERGALETTESVRIIESVGAALSYAHQQGILHRDVKPSNVLLTKEGQIYLADFGLARIASAGESTLSSDMFIGTPQYISPEQAQGKRDLDEGTDIYSFGVMIYEMLLGRVPFTADTPYAIIHDHIYAPLPLPSTLKPDIPPAVERTLLKALAKDRADRYANISAMVDGLRAALLNPGRIIPADDATVVSDQLDAPVKDVQTIIPTLLQPTTDAAPPPAAAPTLLSKAPPSKRPSIWLFVAPILLVVLVIGFLIGRGVLRNRNPQASPPPPGAQVNEPPTGEPPPDPMALVEDAIALNEAGQRQKAMETFQRAIDLAGDNLEFYQIVGQRLAEKEYWLPAGLVYLRMGQRMPKPYPPEQIPPWHEAWYKASVSPEFPSILPQELLAEVDPLMAAVCQARFTLFNGVALRAEAQLAEVIKQDARMPEAILLQAEILIRLNRTPRAQEILTGLISVPDLPPWIIREAEFLRNNIKP